jgi:hypothetical protein
MTTSLKIHLICSHISPAGFPAFTPIKLVGENKKIGEYLKKDLEITEEIYKRAKSLRITEIQRW